MSSTRNLASLATSKTHYKVLITGGGTGGCSVAAKLRGVIPNGEIGVIEPEEHHYYQGAWTLVGAGIKKLQDTRIPMLKAIPGNAEWIKDRVASYDPSNNKVTTVDGNEQTLGPVGERGEEGVVVVSVPTRRSLVYFPKRMVPKPNFWLIRTLTS
ncbi:unnamed protein product [Rodentolepis nana]|uniref:Pyr_redox_2 domain-containing protein n=1 Tax=Rodentolepis nana TaxID=102285 RepID=A0A0R3T9S0_RODNA|nr:unnamed protein product [Rodentolepis nana]